MTCSSMHIDDSGSILKEIKALIVKRKKLEKEFALLGKRLLKKRDGTVLSSENWEDWKLLSMEYDEMKKTISEIDARHLALKKLRRKLRARHASLVS